MSNRPQFWLQVRKDYILENFESLINYLRLYNYTPFDSHPDYDSTLDCMTELSEEIGAQIASTPYYQPLDLGRDINAVIRLFAATALASNKAGRTPARVIVALVDLLMKARIGNCENEMTRLYEIVLNCVRGREMLRCGFTWDDIIPVEVPLGVFIVKFGRMTFRQPEGEEPSYYIENKGTLVVPPSGLTDLAVMNLFSYDHKRRRLEFELPGMMRVMVPDGEYEDVSDFEKEYNLTTRLLSGQEQMKRSPQTKLLEYDTEEEFVVRVVQKRGLLIVAETVDKDYVRIRGKVLLNVNEKRPAVSLFNESLNEGDYLLVNRYRGDDYAFEIIDTFENFYRNYACEGAAQKRMAIFTGYYPRGTEWLTEDGVRVGIDAGKMEGLDENIRSIVDQAMEERGRAIEVRLYNQPPRTDTDRFFVYAEVTELQPAEEDFFTPSQADRVIITEFIEESRRIGEDILEKGEAVTFLPADPTLCFPLISILATMIANGFSSSRMRLEYITAAAMLCKVLNRQAEYAYLDHERRFLNAQVRFARNQEMPALTHGQELTGAGDVERREDILRVLKGYKKKEPGHKLTSDFEEEKQEKIEALVAASNSLIDIIDDVALDNIKQVIARALGVDDEYSHILDDRTFYGMESISLEFKTSVVFPPMNRRRLMSMVADPEQQKWAIIKAVCGFLNSRSGGELIIGIRDTGYADGVEDDMRKLVEMRIIPAADLDHYRTYVQHHILDYAFKEENTKVLPTDIVRNCITYVPEINAEGKSILRIQIRPYEKGVVSLAASADERPQGIEDSYVRLSGRTVPVSDRLREDIRSYKI